MRNFFHTASRVERARKIAERKPKNGTNGWGVGGGGGEVLGDSPLFSFLLLVPVTPRLALSDFFPPSRLSRKALLVV